MIFQSNGLSFICLFLTATVTAQTGGSDYGLDCSWPIHSKERDARCESMFPHQMELYEEYLEGCRQKWGEKGAVRCDIGEDDRLGMSWRQPRSMVVSFSQYMFCLDTKYLIVT